MGLTDDLLFREAGSSTRLLVEWSDVGQAYTAEVSELVCVEGDFTSDAEAHFTWSDRRVHVVHCTLETGHHQVADGDGRVSHVTARL